MRGRDVGSPAGELEAARSQSHDDGPSARFPPDDAGTQALFRDSLRSASGDIDASTRLSFR